MTYNLNKYIYGFSFFLSICHFLVLFAFIAQQMIFVGLFYAIGGLLWLRIQFKALKKLQEYIDS